MGFELDRFEGEVKEVLLCAICSNVLEEPVQVALCDHTFCKRCIDEWLTRQLECPIDRSPLRQNQLRPAHSIFKTFLAELKISCNYKEQGCAAIVKLDVLESHVQECKF